MRKIMVARGRLTVCPMCQKYLSKSWPHVSRQQLQTGSQEKIFYHWVGSRFYKEENNAKQMVPQIRLEDEF